MPIYEDLDSLAFIIIVSFGIPFNWLKPSNLEPGIEQLGFK
jgi:hypothetical protein